MKIGILLFCILLFSIVFANLYFVFAFDNNYFLKNTFIIETNDTLIINEEKLKDVFFIFTFDVFLNEYIYTGPTHWDHNNKQLLFIPSQNKRIQKNITFSEYFNYNNNKIFSEEKMINMAFSSFDNYYLNYLLSMNKNNLQINNLTLFKNFQIYNDMKNIISYHYYYTNKDFQNALNISYRLYKKYCNDINIFSLYAYSLMDRGAFIEAKNEIETFFSHREKTDYYFSLLVNLYAIAANFQKAESLLLNGRDLFPESKILIEDAIRLYSILDTIKMEKYLEFYNKNYK